MSLFEPGLTGSAQAGMRTNEAMAIGRREMVNEPFDPVVAAAMELTRQRQQERQKMRKRHARPFDYHRPDETAIPRIEAVREAFQRCLEVIRANTCQGSVSGRYVSLSETAMEEAAMWATKSIVFECDNEL